MQAPGEGLLWFGHPDEADFLNVQAVYPYIVLPFGVILCIISASIDRTNNNQKASFALYLGILLYVIGWYMAETLASRKSYMHLAVRVFDIDVACICILVLLCFLVPVPTKQPKLASSPSTIREKGTI